MTTKIPLTHENVVDQLYNVFVSDWRSDQLYFSCILSMLRI